MIMTAMRSRSTKKLYYMDSIVVKIGGWRCEKGDIWVTMFESYNCFVGRVLGGSVVEY